MKQAAKLLPCPFCGFTPSLVVAPTGWIIECLGVQCLAAAKVFGKTEEDAVANWNTRHAEGPARKAIKHTLERIREHPQVGYYCSELTETFSLLTEAAAVLFGEPLEKVRALFKPAYPRK